MSINRIKIRRMENYKEYIRNILKNRDIDCDEAWWDSESAANVLKCMVETQTWYIADSEQMGIDTGAGFLFLKYTQDDGKRKLLDELQNAAGKLIEDKFPENGQPETSHPETSQTERSQPETSQRETSQTERSQADNSQADKRQPGKKQPIKLFMICIVDNMKSRVFLEKKFISEYGKTMKKNIRKYMGGRRGTLDFLYILDNNYGEQDIKLSNVNRFALVEEPPSENPVSQRGKERAERTNHNRGYVTSVHLSQLVEIYNKIGDKLFKRNVRYGLSEQLGVDSAIKNTLRNAPHEFWFKNNGVTILVERPDFNLGRVEEILLEHIEEYADLNFSVVNGAQTITAAAQCLYEMEYEMDELGVKGLLEEQKAMEEKIGRSRNAKVLLRIIHIPHSGQDAKTAGAGSAKEVNEISVALNRQKPIKAEDIAFATPFVEKLAGFLEREQVNGKRQFSLVKRGEGSVINRSIDLVDFAKARKACAGYPGEARSNGTNVLLGFKNESDGDYSFKDGAIFVPEWMEAEDEEEGEVFRKYYGAVKFAVSVADFYSRNVKQMKESHMGRQTVLQNGKWYFTAYMVQLFNQFRKDYTEFTDCFDLIRDKLPELMELYAQQCEALARTDEKYVKLDSNVFKSNDLYHLVLKEADSELFAQVINRDLDEEERIEFTSNKEPEAPEEALAREQSGIRSPRPSNGKAKFIQMNGSQKERVNSTAHAMVKSVRFVLENYPGCEDKLLRYCSDWFTDDQERVREGYSYLRRVVELTGDNGRVFWVGTHSASSVKYSQMEDMCRYAGVKKEMIRWYTADGETPLFVW